MPVVNATAHNLTFRWYGHIRVTLSDEFLILLYFFHGFSINMNRTAFIVPLIASFCHLLSLIAIDDTFAIIDR